MNEQQKSEREQTDEPGSVLETGNEVNEAIEEQGDDAAAGILRGEDAAKHEKEQQADENTADDQ